MYDVILVTTKRVLIRGIPIK